MKRKISILFLFITIHCFSQKEKPNPTLEHHFGFQAGYSHFHAREIEGGLNYYWSYNRDREGGCTTGKFRPTHTYGPFLCADLVFNNKTTYAGERFGFNYAYLDVFYVRISPAIEHIQKKDFYAGTDIGVSLMGFFFYYGYYVPLNNSELPGFSRNRIGIRIVFNLAPLDASSNTGN